MPKVWTKITWSFQIYIRKSWEEIPVGEENNDNIFQSRPPLTLISSVLNSKQINNIESRLSPQYMVNWVEEYKRGLKNARHD